MPNVYGGNIFNKSLQAEDMYSAASLERCLEIERKGNTAYVAMLCGFWFEWSLARGEAFFGFDIRDRKVTMYDDGMTLITTSTFGQVGRAAAALLALPEGVVKEKFANGPLYVGSFTVCQRDILDSLNRVLGTSDGDWEIRYEETKKRYQDGLTELQAGSQIGFAKAMYSRTFFPNGGGNTEKDKGLHNEVLGLEKEDLDDAVKRAVHLVETGWTPGAGYDIGSA